MLKIKGDRRLKLSGDWAPGNKSVSLSGFNEVLFFNLEGPVLKNKTNREFYNPKAGPHLFHSSLPTLKQPAIVNFANNHSFDFGLEGYSESARATAALGWQHVGAGLTKHEATLPLIIEIADSRIGILARCETQFGVAQEKTPGVAAFDATIFEQIRQLKKQADIVIASVHAAAEMLPWPSPDRQDTWRALIDSGADIVHGHHAHVPQGWEEYNGGWIFYGLGNFCVDPLKWSWHPNGLWSLAPELFYASERIEIDFKTSVIEDQGDKIHVRESTEAERSEHLFYFDVCNKPLADRLLLEGLWQEAAIRMYNHHYADWLGFCSGNKKSIYRSMRSMVGTLKRLISKNSTLNAEKRKYLLHYHLFACESHNEAIKTALGVLGGELDDLRTLETTTLVDEWMIDR